MLSFLAVQIYIATIIGGMLINASLPLAFEMGSELAFPVSEGIVGGLLTCLINLSGIIFLLVLLIPDIGMFLSLHIIMMLQIFITCTSLIYRGQEITIWTKISSVLRGLRNAICQMMIWVFFDKEPCTYVTRMTGTYMYAIIIVTIIVW